MEISNHEMAFIAPMHSSTFKVLGSFNSLFYSKSIYCYRKSLRYFYPYKWSRSSHSKPRWKRSWRELQKEVQAYQRESASISLEQLSRSLSFIFGLYPDLLQRAQCAIFNLKIQSSIHCRHAAKSCFNDWRRTSWNLRSSHFQSWLSKSMMQVILKNLNWDPNARCT